MLNYIEKDDILLTNDRSLDWTVLDYYIPDNKHLLIDNMYFSELNTNKTYYLAWGGELPKPSEHYLIKNKWKVELILRDAYFGNIEFNFYKISR